MIQLAMMFQSGMVLQRDKKVAVFGTAAPGEKVVVSMQGKTAETMPDADGKWQVQAGPFACSVRNEMVISQGEERLVLQDVAVGEVWFAGGQSNMEFYMRYDRGYEAQREEVTGNPLPDVRFFDYPEVSYEGQLDEADYTKCYGFWRRGSAGDLQWWSAVAWYFAREIYEKYQVPVGIVGCNWGGTPIAAWLPEEVLHKAGADFYLEEYAEQTKDLDTEAYDAAFRSLPRNYRTNCLTAPGNEIEEFILHGDYGEDLLQRIMGMVMEQARKAGITVTPEKIAAARPPMGPKHEWRPCGLYYSMLLHVVPYTVRGILWYQGESDSDEEERAKLYEKTFPALINHWRSLFGDPELPFLFVQTAPYEKWMSNTSPCGSIVRRAQTRTAATVPHTGMAVITDDGMRWNIHPVMKAPVGHRLALLAENKVYGDTCVLCEAPLLTDVHSEGGRAVLVFDNVGSGLHLSEQSLYGDSIPAHTLHGVVLTQNGKKIFSEDCRADVSGSKVTLTSPQIEAGTDIHAAVAGEHWYQVNLYNSANIPAQPAEA